MTITPNTMDTLCQGRIRIFELLLSQGQMTTCQWQDHMITPVKVQGRDPDQLVMGQPENWRGAREIKFRTQ